MDRQGLVAEQLVRELGDQLLRELMRAVHIVATANETRQLEAPEVGLDEELSSSFRGSVRIRRFEDVLFRHGIRVKVFSFPIHFIGTHMDKALQRLTTLGRLEQDVGSVDVGFGEGE
jgi:hypothetical protein